MPDYVERSEVLRVIGEYDCRGFAVEDVRTITDGCKKAVSELPTAEVVPADFHERCLLGEIHKRFELEKELKGGNKTMEMEKLVYSVPECANVLGLGLSKTRELINSEGFPAIHIGRRVVVPVEQLKEWMKKQPTIGSGQSLADVMAANADNSQEEQ